MEQQIDQTRMEFIQSLRDTFTTTDEEGYVKVLADPSALEAMEEALAAAGINEFETDEVKLIPSEELELNDEKLAKFERLLAMLDEVDDVQSVYHNVKLPESEEE